MTWGDEVLKLAGDCRHGGENGDDSYLVRMVPRWLQHGDGVRPGARWCVGSEMRDSYRLGVRLEEKRRLIRV